MMKADRQRQLLKPSRCKARSYRLNTGSSHRPQLPPFRSDAFSTISSSVLTPG